MLEKKPVEHFEVIYRKIDRSQIWILTRLSSAKIRLSLLTAALSCSNLSAFGENN